MLSLNRSIRSVTALDVTIIDSTYKTWLRKETVHCARVSTAKMTVTILMVSKATERVTVGLDIADGVRRHFLRTQITRRLIYII